MTVSEWWRSTAALFREAGFDSATLEAQVLAAHALGKDRSWVLAHPDAQMVDMGDALAQRRLRHEPLAYLLGWREFYGRRFAVSSAVLIPRHETETLVEAALDRMTSDHGRALDVGTGSGAIAITLALERPWWEVVATDLSEEALEVARGNAEALGASVRFEQADLFPREGGFDLIVSNPPYVARGDEVGKDVAYEPELALYAGETGLEVYERLAREAGRWLAGSGSLMLEIGAGQAGAVVELFERQGWRHAKTRSDLQGIERVLAFNLA